MKSVTAIILAVWLVVIVSWVNNVVDFVDCDFKEDYRCEMLHGIGMSVPPTSIVTAWFESDGGN